MGQIKVDDNNNNTAPMIDLTASAPTSSSGSFSFVSHPKTTNLELSCCTEFNVVNYATSLPMMMCMATLKAPQYNVTARAPIDICAVVDRSGSMSGTKLNLVKQTLRFVIEQLGETDRLEIISYDDYVATNLPLTRMDGYGKPAALNAVNSINCGGSTNLSGGLLAALNSMRNRPIKNKVASVLLFTDGQANVGLTAGQDIVNAMRSGVATNPTSVPSPYNNNNSFGSGFFGYPNPAAASSYVPSTPSNVIPLSCTVNTFGFGGDHDANLLKQIADAGDGVYYYIAGAEAIATSFADCLGGLLSVVAQNIKLTIEMREGVRITKIHSKYQTRTVREGIHYEITCPDLQSEESKDILFSVALPALPVNDDRYGIVRMRADYLNVVEGAMKSIESVGGLARPLNSAPTAEPNYNLDKQRNRVTAAEAMDQANTLAKQNMFDQARRVIQTAIDMIRRSISGNDAFSINLITDLNTCMNGLRDKTSYVSVGSQMLNNNMSSHYHQRSTNYAMPAQACYQTSNRVHFVENVKKYMK